MVHSSWFSFLRVWVNRTACLLETNFSFKLNLASVAALAFNCNDWSSFAQLRSWAEAESSKFVTSFCFKAIYNLIIWHQQLLTNYLCLKFQYSLKSLKSIQLVLKIATYCRHYSKYSWNWVYIIVLYISRKL